MGRRGHGPPPGLRQNPPGPGRYHSTLPHLPSPRPGRWTPPLSLTSASTVAMAGAPERSPAPSAAPHALAPPLSPHSSQWRRSAGHRACATQHGGPRVGLLPPYGVMAAPVRRLPYSWSRAGGVWDGDGVRRGQGWDGDRRGDGAPRPHRHPQSADSLLFVPRRQHQPLTPRVLSHRPRRGGGESTSHS